jgi:Tfp pilus assembly protein PilF
VEEQNEERTTALHILAYCLISKPDPDWEYAIKTTQEELSLLEEGQKEERAKALHDLAECFSTKSESDINDYDKADEMHRKALEIEPDNTIYIENYAIFLKNIRKDYDKADEMYRKALEIEPNNNDYFGNYAGFLLAKGDKENGFKLLKQIISFADKQSVLLECWFYCYAHTKK